jgi:hypothetical protein
MKKTSVIALIFCLAMTAAQAFSRENSEKDREFTVKALLKTRFILDEYKETVSLRAAKPEEKKRGYIVFVRDYAEKIHTNTVPKAEEITDKIGMFASLGEYQPVSIGIFPLEDLKDFKVSATGLKNESGGAIADANIILKMGYLQVLQVGRGIARPGFNILVKPIPVDIPLTLNKWGIDIAGTRQYWLTIKIPDNAAPGKYKGEVKFSGSKPDNAFSLPVEMEVLPFKLMQDPEPTWGCDYYPKLDQIKDWKEHNLTGYGIYSPGGGEWEKSGGEVHFKPGVNIEPILKEYVKVGFKGPLQIGTGDAGGGSLVDVIAKELGCEKLSAEWKKHYKFTIEEMRDYFKSKGYDKMVDYWTVDEPDGQNNTAERRANMQGTLDVLKTITGIEIAGLPNSPQSIEDFLFQMTHPTTYVNSGLTADVIKRAKARGIKILVGGFWLKDPKMGRLKNGLWHWKSGVWGETVWLYYSGDSDDYNDLDGSHEEWNLAFPPRQGETEWNPGLAWESYRKGIDDYKYIYTLQTLIKNAKPEKSSIAKEAQKLLDDMATYIPVDNMPSWVASCDMGKVEKFRRQTADYIVKLQ